MARLVSLEQLLGPCSYSALQFNSRHLGLSAAPPGSSVLLGQPHRSEATREPCFKSFCERLDPELHLLHSFPGFQSLVGDPALTAPVQPVLRVRDDRIVHPGV